MKWLFYFMTAIIFSFPYLFSQESSTEKLSLTLKECILKALENNLDLSVAVLNPEISQASISESKEQFFPKFSLGYSYRKQTQLGTWGVEGTNVLYKSDNYSLGLTQKVISGGSLTLSFYNSMTDTSKAFTVINPSYYSQLELNLNQPLLRGFGPKASRIEIIRAQNLRDVSLLSLKSALLQTIYEIEEAYWNLFYAVEYLKVMEYSLEQSKEMLKKNMEAARIGTRSGIEVLTSETEVARWQDSLLSAQIQVDRMEDRLKKIMNISPEASISSPAIVIAERPAIEKREIKFEDALKSAFEERPEMGMAQKEIESSETDISYYKNQLLPQLDFSFSLWNPGQSGIRYIYLNDDPFTEIIVDRIEGSRRDSLKDVFKRTYKNWQLNLSLTVPLGNVFSRASLAKARLEKEQSLARLENQKKSVSYEIVEILKELKVSEKRLNSSAHYRELMEKRLEAETQRYDLGLVGSEWLFEYQRRLATAKTDEIKALIDYKISMARLEKSLGTTLKTKGIKFRNYDF